MQARISTSGSKIIVAGRPRSGTSLMMRILDVSGYSCLRDLEWEEKMRPGRKNKYFYENKKFVHGADLSLLKDYDAGKVLLHALPKLYGKDVKVIWMDRKKESVIKSWKSYDRLSMIKADSYEEDYAKNDENEILKNLNHIRISYDKLINHPTRELTKLSSYVTIDMRKSLVEINPSMKHY